MIYNTSASSAYALPTTPWTGTMPVSPCVGACPTPGANLTGPAAKNIETTATYTMTLTPASLPRPTGTIAFYNGDDLIPGCEAVVLTPIGTTKSEAKCDAVFHGFGTQWITAVYAGDAVYNEVKDTKSTLATPNAVLGEQDVYICTGAPCGTALCTAWVGPDGGNCTVQLKAPPKGASYQGMLIFQDRISSHGLQIWPYKGLAPCVGTGSPPNWMIDHTGEGDINAPYPDPCGPLGGMTGTIYAPHMRCICTIAGEWDATIEIHASGVTTLQIIAGRINLIHNDDARFLFKPEEFVGGGPIALVE
jgi:hypothetical protein